MTRLALVPDEQIVFPKRWADLSEASWLFLTALGAGQAGHVFTEGMVWDESAERTSQTWLPTWRPLEVALYDLRALLRLHDDVQLLVVPRENRGARKFSSCLWARAEGSAAVGRLSRCGEWKAAPPAPSLVLQDGKALRQTALWILKHPLETAWTQQANRRLAYWLGVSAGAMCDPDLFAVRPPGSKIWEGRRRPSDPIKVVRLAAMDYTPAEVVGRLKEAPSPDAWRERA